MPEDEAPSSFAFVGARLLGPLPLSDVWVDLIPGVHALYGLNGAGKTRVLTALADLLDPGSTSGGESYLVVESREGGSADSIAPLKVRGSEIGGDDDDDELWSSSSHRHPWRAWDCRALR